MELDSAWLVENNLMRRSAPSPPVADGQQTLDGDPVVLDEIEREPVDPSAPWTGESRCHDVTLELARTTGSRSVRVEFTREYDIVEVLGADCDEWTWLVQRQPVPDARMPVIAMPLNHVELELRWHDTVPDRFNVRLRQHRLSRSDWAHLTETPIQMQTGVVRGGCWTGGRFPRRLRGRFSHRLGRLRGRSDQVGAVVRGAARGVKVQPGVGPVVRGTGVHEPPVKPQHVAGRDRDVLVLHR